MALPARWSKNAEVTDPTDEVMEIQMGPSHPASHGTIKFNLKLDGERIVDCDVEVGYLHRGFEKMCEQGTWTQCFPYTDRLNYASPCINNVGFALAVERLLGVSAPERCQYARVIMSEVHRLADHLTCLGMAAGEVGAQSVMFYMMEAREFLYDLVEAVTGARLTVTWCRAGGITRDLPADLGARIALAFSHLDGILSDCDKLLSRNRVFIDRMADIGVMAADEAISYGLSGPLLRASGVAYDVRKAHPYWSTIASSSRSRPATRATTTTASTCASRRCISPGELSNRRCARCPRGQSRLTIRASCCRPRSASTIPSRG
jgi:NADH-quinone oxidoreductase subunit D